MRMRLSGAKPPRIQRRFTLKRLPFRKSKTTSFIRDAVLEELPRGVQQKFFGDLQEA